MEDQKEYQLEESELKNDLNNSRLTTPRSYGVYKIIDNIKGRIYRYGNHPIRKIELEREYGKVEVLYIFSARKNAKKQSDKLNGLSL